MSPQVLGLFKPLLRFAKSSTNASALLFIAAILAMILANSPYNEWYQNALAHPVVVRISSFNVFSHNGHYMSMLEFVNDALMAVFFFVVGLEIKREILVGELSSFRKAILPIIAALGGMVVPVLVYYFVCNQAPGSRGMAIPMATDIAFALGVLSLLGRRVPLSLRIFLTALAVVDDIGGILIIALFYSGAIAYKFLFIAFALLILLYVGNKFRVSSKIFYYLIGFFVWILFLESGIHPTIAGVLVAFTVPARPKINLESFVVGMKDALDKLRSAPEQQNDKATVLTHAQIHTLKEIEWRADRAISPLQDMVDDLEPFVNYLVLPLFAFVNAGITISSITLDALMGVSLAVFLGLVVGKTIGIYTFTYIFIKLKLVRMPSGLNKQMLLAVSMLGGIGFTVALFIANLSFVDSAGSAELLNQAKIGVFSGSLISGLMGYFMLKKVLPKEESVEA